MNLDLLKKQASRLAAYLGTNHRLNLKRTSALEALAAAYGARNWQTLAAQASTERDQDSEKPSQGAFPLTWFPDGQPHLLVTDTEWERHALAYGNRKATREWLVANMAHCRDVNMGGLFFDVGGDIPDIPAYVLEELAPEVYDMRQHEADSTAKRRSPQSGETLSINLLAGLTGTQAAAVLCALTASSRGMPKQTADAGKAEKALALYVEAILAAKKPLTVSTLCRIQEEPTHLHELLQATTPSVKNELQAWLIHNSHPAADDELGKQLFAHINDVLARLQSLRETEPEIALLFSDKNTAFSLNDLLNQKKVILVRLPAEDGSRRWCLRFWLAVLQVTTAQRAGQPPAARERILFGLPDVGRFMSKALTRIANQGRSAGVVLRLTASNEEDLATTAQGTTMLENTFHRLYLGDRKDNVRAKILQRLESAPGVLINPNSCAF